MTKKLLIDAHQPEETRVVMLNGNKIEEFDYESTSHKQLKGNVYLARVTRVEPSLQAAFVEYGGNRQGFLAFSEIHPDYYRIPVEDREALEAEQAGADYVAFGTMFASPTKPAAVTAGTDLITEAKKQLSIPVCAIGGIDISNVEDVVNAGADMTALINGLFAAQDIQSTARQISELFR